MTLIPSYETKSPDRSRRKLKVAATIDTALAIGEVTQKLYVLGRNWYHNHFAYTVSISEKDALYNEVHKWLIGVLPHEKHKDLEVSSTGRVNRRGVVEASEPDDGSTFASEPDPLIIRFSDKSMRSLRVGDHKVQVSLVTPEKPDKSAQAHEWYDAYAEIVFLTYSYEAQQAVILQLEQLNRARAKTRKAVLKMMGQWGDWRTRSDLPPRTMESVNLPQEQKDRIVSDLKHFLDSEDTYNRLAIPWHRGYMFYGPPGTGKTSLVKALANYFNLDLWYISLSDLKAETSLLGLLSSVGPRSMLLLEDIDTIKITHDRDGSDQGTISMGSLLNTLDGVATPHGLVTAMTTNRFDILDPALTRAGRMDLVEMLDYPSVDTVKDMFHHFYGETLVLPRGTRLDAFKTREIATANIAEVMKRHLDEPAKAVKHIREMVK